MESQQLKIPQISQENAMCSEKQISNTPKSAIFQNILAFISGFFLTLFSLLIYSYFIPYNQQCTHPQIQPDTPNTSTVPISQYPPNFQNILISTVIATHELSAAQYFYQLQQDDFQFSYRISKYPQKQFCVIVPTYNNAENDRCILNIKTIIGQTYDNFKVVIIDDASTDKTYQLIEQYIKGLDLIQQNKIVLKKNIENKKALQNIYWAAHNFCSENSIMTIVDGDDFLLGNSVLKLFNAIYHREDVWLVYSNFLSQYKNLGFSNDYTDEIKKEGKFRTQNFKISHQHTFYTKLFRKIKEKDLKNSNDEWFKAAYDIAIYIPMAEMARERIKYLPIATYYYNINTGYNDHFINAKQQAHNQRLIQMKPIYAQIHTLD